jgi:DNA-binding MarR family transcriptional regulator
MKYIDEKLKILQPVLGPERIDRLRQMYFFEDDFREKKELESHMDLLISRYVKKDVNDQIILPPLPKDLCAGHISIGELEYLGRKISPLYLRLKDINRHVGIFGSTGTGKTTFALNLIRQLHKKGLPVLIFDWEKSYRSLINKIPDLQVFTVGSDINPLFLNFLTVPPGIEFDEYIKSIVAIISEDYIGGIGADTMLLNYMEMAFQETGHPYFEDLKQIVLREINKDMGRKGRLTGRSGLWKESVSRQITFMSKGGAGTVVNPRKHYPLEDLFSKPVVLEFGNLKSPYDRKFFIHVILNWLSIYNQHCGMFSQDLKQVLIFEEFHNIVMKGKHDNMVSTLFRESRKYGVGLVAIDQTPSEIPNSIFANMNVKVSFALATNRDIIAMSKAMNLDFIRSRYLGMLNTGQAVVNIRQRHVDSFLIEAPFVKPAENICDQELKEAMKKFSQVSGPEPVSPEIQRSPRTSQGKDNFPPLDPIEKVVLTRIVEKPLEGVDERIKKLGMHPSQMVRIHRLLVDKGVLEPVYINRKKLFELTEKGKTVAENSNIFVPARKTRGGLSHYYWIMQVAALMKNMGLDPAIESQGTDITETSESLAIEIETGKSNISANMEKLAKSEFKNCYVLATERPVEMKIKKLAENYPAIKVFYVKDFMKLFKEKITSNK